MRYIRIFCSIKQDVLGSEPLGPGLRDPEGPGTKNSRDSTSPKVPVLENWRSP